MGSIDQAYRNLIPDLKELESYRLKKLLIIGRNRSFLLFYLFLSLAGIIITVATDTFEKEDWGMVISIIVLFLFVEGVVALIIYAINIGKYREYFKENIIERLVPAMVPGVSYKHDGHISFESFREFKLLNKREANRIDGSDHFFGKMGDMPFELSWLNIYHETIVRESGPKDFKYRKDRKQKGADLINGVFMIAGLSQTLKSTVDIVPSFKEYGKLIKAVSSSLDVIGKSDLPEVEIGASEFQEMFKVHSEDEALAKGIVHKSLKEELVRIKKENKLYQVYATFMHDRVYVAIDGAKDLFEPKIKDTLLNPDSTKGIFMNLLTYISILKVFVSGGELVSTN